MKLTTEERMRIFASYWGRDARMLYRSEFGDGVDCKVDGRYIDSILLRVYLKDIADITDEECIEVGRIAGFVEDRYNNTRLLIIMRAKKLLSGEDHFTPTSSIDSWAEIVDYLRLQGYAIPYKGHSLFDLDIAMIQI